MTIRKRRSSQALFVVCMLLLGVSGCVFWHNFSTNFNTLYLAEWHLDAYEAQQKAIVPPNANGAVALLNHRWFDEEFAMRQRSIKEGDPISIVPSFSQSLSATKEITNVHLDSAIILGSKILADKNPSKYVEDALLVVGKAQFYKNDFTGAQRKFLELLYKFPQTKHMAEVEVFLTRATILNHHLDTATAELDHAIAVTAQTNDKLAMSGLHRAKAELIYAMNHDSLAAIASELHQAEDGLEGEQLARLAYEEGAVYYMNADWPEAERAFKTTFDNAKDEYLTGEAHIAHALALRESGDLAGARTELQAVIGRAKFGGSHGPARFELAYTEELIARRDVGNNLKSSEFQDVQHPALRAEYFMLDTIYKNSSALILSRSKFRQAEMFREMGYYDSAAKLAAGLIGTKDFSTPAMNSYVSDQASSLASFSRWKNELEHIDSLEAGINHTAPMPVSKPGGQIHNAAAANHLKALQEALGARWNPGRPTPLTGDDSLRVQEIEKRMKDKADPLGGKFTITDTSHFLDSIHFLAATAHYQLGRAYETFGEISQARSEYIASMDLPGANLSASDTAKGAHFAQTLYAWLTLEHREKNERVKDSLLHELLTHYGQTIYAEQARNIYIGIDRNSPGELAYKKAYQDLRDKGIDAAKPDFLQIVATYSQDDVAPRSLYAIGERYEELVRYDSALLYYRRIQREYPFSSYAMSLRPRLADASNPGMAHAPAPTIDPLLTPQNGQMPPDNSNQVPGNPNLLQRGNGQPRQRPNAPQVPPPAPPPGVGQPPPQPEPPPDGLPPPPQPMLPGTPPPHK